MLLIQRLGRGPFGSLIARLTNRRRFANSFTRVFGPKTQPTDKERQRLNTWIKFEVFEIDPRAPDPGRVILRRLNRVEYRNTIRDLLDVDFDTTTDFPPDNTGHGFDNLGSVLTVSPLLRNELRHIGILPLHSWSNFPVTSHRRL